MPGGSLLISEVCGSEISRRSAHESGIMSVLRIGHLYDTGNITYNFFC